MLLHRRKVSMRLLCGMTYAQRWKIHGPQHMDHRAYTLRRIGSGDEGRRWHAKDIIWGRFSGFSRFCIAQYCSATSRMSMSERICVFSKENLVLVCYDRPVPLEDDCGVSFARLQPCPTPYSNTTSPSHLTCISIVIDLTISSSIYPT
jgi:hypothetical protein